MLTLDMLLENAGIPHEDVIVARHTPKEPPLRKIIKAIVAERPDLFRVFQSVQSERLEGAMTRAGYMASFVENGPSGGVFAGLYLIGPSQRVSQQQFQAVPENRELLSLGMDDEWTRDPLMFDMLLCEELSEWIGKLCVSGWSNPRAWWQWSKPGRFPITAIHPENILSQGMPAWDELVLSWSELQILPASWRAKLAEWRGVYLIFDVARSQGYVGSAYGQENILGRWRSYEATGHGGNAKLLASVPTNLRFSILQRTSPDMLPDDVIALEGLWKTRLHTRSHGLNMN